MRYLSANRSLALAVAGAAVVAILALAFTLIPRTDVGATSTATPIPTNQPSLAPSAAAVATSSRGPGFCVSGMCRVPADQVPTGPLDPGTYTSYGSYGTSTSYGVHDIPLNVRFTVPAGWTWNGWYLSKGGVDGPGGAAVFFFNGTDVQVYGDPCQWVGSDLNLPAGFDVLELMDALAAQPTRNATTPVQRNAPSGPFFDPSATPQSVGRWQGMAVELTVPTEINFADCSAGQFRTWGPTENARIQQGPGQRDLMWVIDDQGNGVGGHGQTIFIIDAASFPGTPTQVTSELEAILGSISIGHWG